MKRLTYRKKDGRNWFTNYGARIYCSSQATADTFAKLEEQLENAVNMESVLKFLREYEKEFSPSEQYETATAIQWIYEYVRSLPFLAEKGEVRDD